MFWICFNHGMYSDASVLQSFNASNGYLFERAWSWSDIPIGLHRLNVSISSEWAFVSMYFHLSNGRFTTVWARCCLIYLQCTVIFFPLALLLSYYQYIPLRIITVVPLFYLIVVHLHSFVCSLSTSNTISISSLNTSEFIYLIYIFAFIPPFSHSRYFYVRSSFFSVIFHLVNCCWWSWCYNCVPIVAGCLSVLCCDFSLI